MFTQAKLIMQSYLPKTLEKGMMFLGMQHGEIVVHQLSYVPLDSEDYIGINGAPVEPYIYILGNPNVPDETFCIATPNMIGWFDEGDDTDEMHDITIKEINMILENSGHCEIEVMEQHLDDEEAQEDYIQIVPVLLEDKVTIRYDNEEVAIDDEEDDEENYTCGQCNGSGEGSYDGSTCSFCGGNGAIHGDSDDDDNDDWSDYYPHYDY